MVAAAGYGKSALLEQERPADGVVLPASSVARAGGLPAKGWIGIDDLHDLPAEHRISLLRLVSAAVDQTVIITSRMPLDPGVQDGLRGRVLVRGPAISPRLSRDRRPTSMFGTEAAVALADVLDRSPEEIGVGRPLAASSWLSARPSSASRARDEAGPVAAWRCRRP